MKPHECAGKDCASCTVDDCEERIAQARRERDESVGRHKTAMARKSRTARRISQSEHGALRRPLGDS